MYNQQNADDFINKLNKSRYELQPEKNKKIISQIIYLWKSPVLGLFLFI